MQAIQEEGRSQANFLSACQATLYTSPAEIKGILVASYHILLGQAPTSHPFALLQRTSPMEEQSAPAAPPMPVCKQSSRPKRQHPSHKSCGEHTAGQNHIQDNVRRASQFQAVGDPTLEQGTQAELCGGIQPGL